MEVGSLPAERKKGDFECRLRYLEFIKQHNDHINCSKHWILFLIFAFGVVLIVDVQELTVVRIIVCLIEGRTMPHIAT